ncbi:MAG: ABC transporter ATP-binding protein [Bacillota bacterium]|nr:ABC transporter ATP-binding protein [Bacillota bacterium]
MDFKVIRGSIHGFLGPNGAGKTTAIKIILGLMSASSGNIKVLGEPLRFGNRLSYLRYVNYLPQDPVFPEGLSGKESLNLVADIYKVDQKKSRHRVERLLEHFQLEDAANRKVGAYSRGMKQRLGIAAVLLTEPELLILDEPVSALDPEGRRRVLDIISKLKGRATVFFSSHILADVERICDHVTIINQGKKLLDASMNDLLKRYAMEQYLITVKPDQYNKAAALIQTRASVRQVSLLHDKILVISEPGESIKMAEELIPFLINEDITVTEFMQNRSNLEEVFFRILDEYQQGGQEK